MGIFFEVGLEYAVWKRLGAGWEHQATIIPLRLLDARLTKSSLLPEAQKRLEASYHQSKRPREYIGQEIPDIQLTDFECMRAQEALAKAQTQKPDAHFSVAFGWSHVTHCTY